MFFLIGDPGIGSGLQKPRELTKGGLVKGGSAICVFPLCNCNTLRSVLNA